MSKPVVILHPKSFLFLTVMQPVILKSICPYFSFFFSVCLDGAVRHRPGDSNRLNLEVVTKDDIKLVCINKFKNYILFMRIKSLG